MQNILIKYYLFALLAFLGSCKKFVEVPLPKNQIQSINVFENDQTAISAVSGLYSSMAGTNLFLTSGGLTLYPGFTADEISSTNSNMITDQFYYNSILPTLSNLNGFWSYRAIYVANRILEGLDESSSLTASVKNQLKGEMLFVRAFHYFYAINLFGEVPLITTTRYEINSTKSRTEVSAIYEQIISDLNTAISILNEAYPSINRARINKWAAVALLSRVYLYKKDWANAELRASEVINAGSYSLQSNLNQVFTINSNEVIWQLSRETNNTAEGSAFIPASSTVKPLYVLTPYLINSFEPGDIRKSAWIGKNTIGGQDYFYPYKYKARVGPTVVEYYVVFRLAEMYLIRAEARARQNKTNEALQDLNKIKNRAGLPNYTFTDPAALLDAIDKEKRIEFFAEWGHRWFDLIRNGKADAVLGAIKGSNWQSTDQLWPIPQGEINLNPQLSQNPGY